MQIYVCVVHRVNQLATFDPLIEGTLLKYALFIKSLNNGNK